MKDSKRHIFNDDETRLLDPLPTANGGTGNTSLTGIKDVISIVTKNEINQPNGLAVLDANKKISLETLPVTLTGGNASSNNSSISFSYDKIIVEGSNVRITVFNVDSFEDFSASFKINSVEQNVSINYSNFGVYPCIELSPFSLGNIYDDCGIYEFFCTLTKGTGTGEITINGQSMHFTIIPAIVVTPKLTYKWIDSTISSAVTLVYDRCIGLVGPYSSCDGIIMEIATDIAFTNIVYTREDSDGWKYGDNATISFNLALGGDHNISCPVGTFYFRMRYKATFFFQDSTYEARMSEWTDPVELIFTHTQEVIAPDGVSYIPYTDFNLPGQGGTGGTGGIPPGINYQ